MKINANMHNRFDFVTIEKGKPIKKFKLGDKGEYEVEGTEVNTSHNVILDALWSKLCNARAFGGYIVMGKGTGIPAATDTGMFSYVTGKRWIEDAIYRGFDADGVTPLAYWRGYIQFGETEQNGVTFTEVGVADGTSNYDCSTHALLQDAEGNPISFEKTSSKILRVYATIYSTLTTADSNAVWVHPSSNALLSYFVGYGLNDPAITVSNSRANTSLQKYCLAGGNAPSFSIVKSAGLSADVPNKRRVAAPVQFSSTEAMINCINSVGLAGVGFVNKNQHDNANVAGVDYTDKVVGIGNGVNKAFDVLSFNSATDSVSSTTHGSFSVKSEILPSYMSDSYLTDFSGIENVYYSKYNVIKDSNGDFKSYLYKGYGVLSRMHKGVQHDFTQVAEHGMAFMSDVAVVLSCDGLGVDDGYMFDFKNKLMRVGHFDNDVFTIDNFTTEIQLDEDFSEQITKAYVYKDKRFLLVSENFAGLYEQVARNSFEKIWKIETPKSKVATANSTEHVYKGGKYWQSSLMSLPEKVYESSMVYDSTNDRVLVAGGGIYTTSDIAYTAKYNPASGMYDYTANNLPTAIYGGLVAHDSTNDRILIFGGSGGSASDVAYVAKYNSVTELYDYMANNLPTSMLSSSMVYDSINDRILITGGDTATAYVAKYNLVTGVYDYTANSLPVSMGKGSMVYDSTNDRILIAGDTATAYVAKYNLVTGKYDYTANSLPTSMGKSSMAYDSTNDRILIADGGYGASDTAYIAKYNSATGKYDYTANYLPKRVNYVKPVHDNTNDRILVACGFSSTTAAYVAKYNSATGKYDYAVNGSPEYSETKSLVYDSGSDIVLALGHSSDTGGNTIRTAKYDVDAGKFGIRENFITVQNINTGAFVGTESLSRAISLVGLATDFAITHNQLAIDGDGNKTVITFNPATLEYVRKKAYVSVADQQFTSTPEFDVSVSARNAQRFHHGIQNGYGEIGERFDGNVAYLSDCIIKAPYSFLSEETSIPEGVSYVEFVTAPANNEKVKLSWHCKGYDKQGALGIFTFSAGGYVQFGS